MADDRIEIEVVLDDGSIQKGFAKIRKEGDKTEKSLRSNFKNNFGKVARGLNTVRSSVFNLRNAFLGLTAAVGGAAFLRTVTQAAAQQEDAVNALNVSLQTAGTFSKEASEGFQELARELQSQSRFGDEVILQQAALARNYARSNEEAEKLIRVSIDLAEATGTSLDSAVRNLGKTFSGLTGELGEAVPQVRGLTAEQLKAGEALNVLAERFGGSAALAVRSFSGATAQLTNIFGDLLEKLGDRIIRSPAVINLVTELSKAFTKLGNSFKEFGDRDFIGDILRDLVTFGQFVNDFVLRPLEFIGRGAVFAFGLFKQAILTVLTPITSLLEGLAAIAEFAGFEGTITEALKTVGEVTRKQFVENAAKTSDAFFGTFNQEFSNKAEKALATVQGILNRSSRKLVEKAVQNTKKIVGGVNTGLDEGLETFRKSVIASQKQLTKAIRGNVFDLAKANEKLFVDAKTLNRKQLEELKAQLAEFSETTLQTANQLSNAFKNGFARVIASSVQTLATGLAQGTLNFKQFGKQILGLLGDIAIQIGTTVIAGSKALASLFTGNPAGGIAFGAALIAVGALLKAGATGGISGAAGAGVPPAQDAITSPITDDLQDQGARVQVNIQGDVLDGDETALRIGELLRDQGFNNALVT